jgi:hypothetical protein
MTDKAEWIEERTAILIYDAHFPEAEAKIKAVKMYGEMIAKKEKRNYRLEGI